jgi:hypothetical protein
VRRHPVGDEESFLWEWLPAATASRKDAAPTAMNTAILERRLEKASVSQDGFSINARRNHIPT